MTRVKDPAPLLWHKGIPNWPDDDSMHLLAALYRKQPPSGSRSGCFWLILPHRPSCHTKAVTGQLRPGLQFLLLQLLGLLLQQVIPRWCKTHMAAREQPTQPILFKKLTTCTSPAVAPAASLKSFGKGAKQKQCEQQQDWCTLSNCLAVSAHLCALLLRRRM